MRMYGGRYTIKSIVVMMLLGVVAAACRDNEDSTTCSSEADCRSGACLVAPVSRLEFCADVARGCPTGYRWASSAGDGLSGLCVEPTLDAGTDAMIDEPQDASRDAP